MPESCSKKSRGKKPHAKVAFSFDHSSINEIEAFYKDSEFALEHLYLKACPADRFFGYSTGLLQAELKEKKAILDRMCSLELLAALEARFRIDYLVRCQKKQKDSLSRNFREIHQQKANRVSLPDDILAEWKASFPEHKTRLDHFQKALDYRNWLAHGRYWQPNRSPHIHKYDYLSIYLLSADILANMGLVEG